MTEQKLVDLQERDEVYSSSFLRVARAKVRYRQSNGEMGEAVERMVVSHGNAVGVVAYDPRTDMVALVRQFRYPIYDSMPEQERQGQGARQAWLLEIVAGLEEKGQSAEETARRELREELGYEVSGRLERIASIYTSPGSNDERITLFFAEVDTSTKQGGGGLDEEGEDTQQVLLPLAEALGMLERGDVRDAKTLIAFQYLALRHRNAAGSNA